MSYIFFIRPLARLLILVALMHAASDAWAYHLHGTSIVFSLLALLVAFSLFRMGCAYLRTWV